jgi:hypothetical protein
MKIDRPSRRGFMRAFIALALIFASFAFTNAPDAHGTTLMRMSVAQMSRTAQVIIRGRCVANETTWEAGEIWTSTTFQVEEVWGGVSVRAVGASQSIRVRLLGGTLGDVTSRVSGIPRFQQGEEVVLFLERTRRGDFSVVSWQQGTFRVRRDRQTGEEVVTQDTSSFATYDPVHRHFEEDGIRSMRTADLRSHVDAALQRKP